MPTVRESQKFQMVDNGRAGTWLLCKDQNVEPASRALSAQDREYLERLSPQEFEAACVRDFGVGAYARETRPESQPKEFEEDNYRT